MSAIFAICRPTPLDVLDRAARDVADADLHLHLSANAAGFHLSTNAAGGARPRSERRRRCRFTAPSEVPLAARLRIQPRVRFAPAHRRACADTACSMRDQEKKSRVPTTNLRAKPAPVRRQVGRSASVRQSMRIHVRVGPPCAHAHSSSQSCKQLGSQRSVLLMRQLVPVIEESHTTLFRCPHVDVYMCSPLTIGPSRGPPRRQPCLTCIGALSRESGMHGALPARLTIVL